MEKQTLMKALGAELIITPTEDGIEGAVEKANQLIKEIPNSFMAKQLIILLMLWLIEKQEKKYMKP